MNIIYPLSFVISLIFIIFFFMNNKFYKSIKFTRYIQIIIAISTFLLAIGVVIQVSSFYEHRNKQLQNEETNFRQNFLQEIDKLFINQDSVNYLFNDLFYNIKVPENTHRNIILERKILTIVLSKIAEQLINIELSTTNNSNLEKTFAKILKNFINTPILIDYWKTYYKPLFASDKTIKYLADNFGI